VAFLFTDVEGSTRAWAVDRAAMAKSLAVHDGIVRGAIKAARGYVFSTGGDGFAAAFGRASEAISAAQRAQAELACAEWPGPVLRVRMGLHIGEAEERDGDYFGPVVNTAARVAAAGHGGQVLLTQAVRAVTEIDAVDLGVHELRDLDRPLRLYQVGDTDFPPLRVVDPALSNLPTRATRIVGREGDLVRVRQLLAEHRWVTVTGFGGLGKTRLAIAVGEAELLHRRDGVWFVDLTAVSGENELPAAIAKALGLTLRAGDAIGQILTFLRDKAALLIVDNCEHVIDATATFADRFLADASPTVVLATSREALAIDGEQSVVLRSLPCDAGDAPAVRLFAERAAAVDPAFALDQTNAEIVATLCRHLDGMPLAIELAAARVPVMTPGELLEGLSDRFALLSSGRHRQRRPTLEATLDWSYELLAPEEQLLLRALGVFVDGFDIDAASAVAAIPRNAAMLVVEALVAKSLVVRVHGGDRARFNVLETVKAYAEQRLMDAGEATSVCDRHLNYFHGLATRRGCSGFSELRVGIGLRRDRNNLAAAFERAAADNRWAAAGELIAGGYAAFVLDGGALDASTMLERAIHHCEADDPDLTDVLHVALIFCLVWLNEWSTIERTGKRLTRSSVPPLRAVGFILMANVTGFSDAEAARAHLRTAEEVLDEVLATEPSVTASVVAGHIPYVRARIEATAGDFASALRDTQAFLTAQSTADFYSTTTPRAIKHAAVCEILLGQPESALRTIEWLDQFDFIRSSTDDVQALTYLALGDIDAAERHIRVHAARAITGRLLGETCDSALLLAALADAEGDRSLARDLVLQMGMGQEAAMIIYSNQFADKLGISVEHAERQGLAMAYHAGSIEGPSGSRMALAAVRNEVRRRGWD
jgi:predicted ATPase